MRTIWAMLEKTFCHSARHILLSKRKQESDFLSKRKSSFMPWNSQ